MAVITDPALGSQMMYCLFVRNHSEAGNFQGVIDDLDRIRGLGTDILWLMPIHPTGIEHRKGADGSPYAIRDYRAIDSAFGSEEDLKKLVRQAHNRDMKVIIDVVFNHTSPDSRLFQAHPEWFYRDAAGKPGSLVPDWSDVIDLDFSHAGLRAELIDTLCYWAKIVDGFRCDVASRVPLDFWLEAREAVEKVHPGTIWLAESCHWPFVKLVRDMNRPAVSDGELYQAFDITYDYDIWPTFEKYIHKEVPLSRWLEDLEKQEAAYPKNYIKLRCLENHDQPRMAITSPDEYSWKNWTALLFMMKGLPLIYHGQEQRSAHNQDFFTKDPIKWHSHMESEDYIARLAKLHKEVLPASGPIWYEGDDEQNTVIVHRPGCVGVFALDEVPDAVQTGLADGRYEDLISGWHFEVKDGKVDGADLPVIVRKEDELGIRPLFAGE